MSLDKIIVLLGLVERDYRGDNPYHNETHAADVTQATHCLMSDPKVNRQCTVRVGYCFYRSLYHADQ